MDKGEWRVGTRGGFAYAYNHKTGERIGPWALWENATFRVNCDTFSPGYQKAQKVCDRLNAEHRKEQK